MPSWSVDNERVTQHVCAELGILITGLLTPRAKR
jgi:hypothetical protein